MVSHLILILPFPCSQVWGFSSLYSAISFSTKTLSHSLFLPHLLSLSYFWTSLCLPQSSTITTNVKPRPQNPLLNLIPLATVRCIFLKWKSENFHSGTQNSSGLPTEKKPATFSTTQPQLALQIWPSTVLPHLIYDALNNVNAVLKHNVTYEAFPTVLRRRHYTSHPSTAISSFFPSMMLGWISYSSSPTICQS